MRTQPDVGWNKDGLALVLQRFMAFFIPQGVAFVTSMNGVSISSVRQRWLLQALPQLSPALGPLTLDYLSPSPCSRRKANHI